MMEQIKRAEAINGNVIYFVSKKRKRRTICGGNSTT